jgi:hypothetical protein
VRTFFGITLSYCFDEHVVNITPVRAVLFASRYAGHDCVSYIPHRF